MVLVRDRPAAIQLAKSDGETEAVVGILLELLIGSAAEQSVRERDIVPGGNVERDDLEHSAVFLILEEGRPCFAVGSLASRISASSLRIVRLLLVSQTTLVRLDWQPRETSMLSSAISAPSVRHVYVELAEALVPAFGIVVPSDRRLEARLGERHFRLRARIRKSNGN